VGVGDCVVCNCRRTDHGYGRRPYAGLADAFGVYFPPTQTTYLVPVGEVLGFEIRLRLKPARNNQRQGIRFAADYEVDTWSMESLQEMAAPPEPLAQTQSA
jgi:hypothetical protein